MARTVLFMILFSTAAGLFPYDGPYIKDGTPLPMPKVYQTSDTVFGVRSRGFQFNPVGQSCDDLDAAFERYYKIIFDTPFGKTQTHSGFHGVTKHVGDASDITGLDVNVVQPCDGKPRPVLGMSESYKLSVTSGKATLNADTLWGALRGLETFSQIVFETLYESHEMFLVNETMIEDEPRFSHRGFLIDTSRHFIENNLILQFISAMSMAKFNVLHWHIVDDESFPYRSKEYPNLSHQGAFEPYTHTYDHDDINEIVEYARQRGIRVIAEFDTPGHTQSWGLGQTDLLTPCYGKDGKPNGQYGPINPARNTTYDFLLGLFTEVSSVFPDAYIHLGGDEVAFDCWQSNPEINAFMDSIGLKKGDYPGLEAYYMTKLTTIVSKAVNHSYIVWQEPLDNGVKLAPESVINVWKWYGDRTAEQEMAFVTNQGYQAITSACWYLNIIEYGEDWQKYYTCDPQNFNGTDAQKKLVVGGEGCMWGEWVDGTNFMSRTWPRAAVVAERLWSPANVTNLEDMKERLEEHRCRMLKRSLDANPIDPSYCRYEKQAPAPLY